eukprot:391755-Rhodomonas_salina.1
MAIELLLRYKEITPIHLVPHLMGVLSNGVWDSYKISILCPAHWTRHTPRIYKLMYTINV